MLVWLWLFLRGNSIKCPNQRSWKPSWHSVWHSVPDVIRYIFVCFFYSKVPADSLSLQHVCTGDVSFSNTHRDTICLAQTLSRSSFFFFAMLDQPILIKQLNGFHSESDAIVQPWNITWKKECRFQTLKSTPSNAFLNVALLWSDLMLQTAKVVGPHTCFIHYFISLFFWFCA